MTLDVLKTKEESIINNLVDIMMKYKESNETFYFEDVFEEEVVNLLEKETNTSLDLLDDDFIDYCIDLEDIVKEKVL